ncbi:MAG: DUF2309 domain-containing protein [Flavobacteriales bacterium]|nr:DUF2309 domain-containing protein [Flavobacteriales bacterium]
MKTEHHVFDEHHVLHQLHHYLPAQAPLKDFVHHNTLHAFQHNSFFKGLSMAEEMFGYRVTLSLREYRELYSKKVIREEIIEDRIRRNKGEAALSEWKEKMLHNSYSTQGEPRIGKLRSQWKKQFGIDLDNMVHPLLFRILCSYLDQGISIWNFPISHKNFLNSIREMERNSFTSFFRTQKVKKMVMEERLEIHTLLQRIVGDERLFESYIYDQQFAHPGWSGMVAVLESQPEGLLDRRKITLSDLIILELLLEIDAMESFLGENWQPLCERVKEVPIPLFAPVENSELHDVIRLWQESYEWSYYDEVLAGLLRNRKDRPVPAHPSFQAAFCIDDRECSIRRHLEHADGNCVTYGTPGFFGVEFFYKPAGGKFVTKLCPAPVTPNYLIKELEAKGKRKKDVHLSKRSHGLIRGWIISQTVGFWAALRLFSNIFRPRISEAAASSFRHMEKGSRLQIECTNPDHKENGLQVGFTIEEMIVRVEGVLRSIGLIENFAPLIYMVSHGASSVNNPHYSAYDCGACSGRPGSVNARVISFMANHPKVREALKQKGIDIPENTQFIGAIHDTTRDEIMFYDEESIFPSNQELHQKNIKLFEQALDANAKERSRRFESINTGADLHSVHDRIRERAVSLFEPRPELNHATNTLCIVGRRELTKGLFLDRRAFMNSYNFGIDPDGKYLFGILKAAAPVCGGINLEYYFSRVDNYKLGAGTKLPHNVMGLFGVANGADGDLRPGLPSQMIEVHDPIRLLIIVEHDPDVILKTIQSNADTYEWFEKEWVHLVAVRPADRELFYFKNGQWEVYHPFRDRVPEVHDLDREFEKSMDNLPVIITD